MKNLPYITICILFMSVFLCFVVINNQLKSIDELKTTIISQQEELDKKEHMINSLEFENEIIKNMIKDSRKKELETSNKYNNKVYETNNLKEEMKKIESNINLKILENEKIQRLQNRIDAFKEQFIQEVERRNSIVYNLASGYKLIKKQETQQQ